DMYGQLMQQQPQEQQQQQHQLLHPQSHHRHRHHHHQHQHHHPHHHPNAAEIRTVYLGNIPNDVSVSDIIDHVKSGPIQAIRPLPEKNGIFITFIDSYAASQFYHEAQRNRLTIHGHELKIGWGKPSVLSPHMQLTLQNGASRNVYLGQLDESVAEQELQEDLSRFGHIEHIKVIPERRIAFVHYLCVSNAVKCVNTLPTESRWQNQRINFGKDRCAARASHPAIYQHPLPQPLFHAAPPHPSPPPSSSSSSLSAQLPPPPPPATALLASQFDLMTLPVIYNHPLDHHMGGVANRTIYLGNIHPDTTAEDICNVIRGGILSQIRFLPDKHIAFVTFVDPQAASIFLNEALHHCIVIKHRRLKIGWGKPAALPVIVMHAVQNGGSRNVYVGNIDDTVTEEKLKHDFSEYGNIELVNTLKEKNCAFVNFTSIVEAVRAIEGIRTKEEYKKFRINYGKDRCGKAPRFQLGYNNNNSNNKYNSSNTTEQDENQVEIKHENTTMSNTTESNVMV
ncbi:hypothetical protein MBANPS3_000805, partial [Mucor bainieri]